MKVLLCNRPGGAFGYITDGWANALRDKGHKVQRYDGNENSWHDFGPDLYIGCSGHKQPIPPRRSNCKIAIHVNPYGPVDIKGINESEQNIRWTLNQKPDCVFGYGHEEDRLLWSYWTQKHGVPWVPMPTAGDRVIFKQTRPLSDRPYDVVYLGGRWAYKGLTIDAYLVPLLERKEVTYKLHGWGDWQPGLCSGMLAEDKANDFLNMGKVGPCISEQHTHSHGIDIPERAFKIALCGTLVVHDAAVSVKRMIPSALIAHNPEQFQEYIRHFSRVDKQTERMELVAKQRNEVLSAHTYHHRLAGLFTALGMNDDAAKMLV